MSEKTGYAKYTFAFASDIQKLADEKHIKLVSFNSNERRSAKGYYDYLTVSFVIPRPDKDREAAAKRAEAVEPTENTVTTLITETEEDLEKDKEVINNDI